MAFIIVNNLVVIIDNSTLRFYYFKVCSTMLFLCSVILFLLQTPCRMNFTSVREIIVDVFVAFDNNVCLVHFDDENELDEISLKSLCFHTRVGDCLSKKKPLRINFERGQYSLPNTTGGS